MKSSGNIKYMHDYEPFGVELPPTIQAESKLLYTGQERDTSTGYDYMHFRFYASSMGRFLKPDNIIPDITNPQNWNAYSYVKGNPVNFNDPSGHMPIGGWGPVGSESNKTFPDNGEPPSLGGWADNIGQTVSNIKYELIKAGFSKEAVDRAEKEGNLKPVVKVYVVHGEDKDKKGGHVAISATHHGESIWWSHGGSVPLYGRKGPEAEQLFLEYYRNDKVLQK